MAGDYETLLYETDGYVTVLTENCLSMFARRDSHAIGARAFKEGRTPEWPNHGL